LIKGNFLYQGEFISWVWNRHFSEKKKWRDW